MNGKEFLLEEINISEIDIISTLFSGQSFRWNYYNEKEKSIYGVIHEDLFIINNIKSTNCTISTTKKFSSKQKFEDFIRHYFSLETNINALFPATFQKSFPEIWRLIQPYMTIKILRQDAFEILISFMCAQGLGMKIIRQQVSYLAKELGNMHTVTVNNKPFTYYSFPTPEILAVADPESLKLCTNNNCIRAKNIINIASSIASGQFDLESLKNPEIPLESARGQLCEHPGVGLKIADCVLLFGMHRFSAFPIDTHVRQYLSDWFSINEALQSLTQKNYLFLQEQACRILTPQLAGYAGHILFHCWRKEVKHLDSY